LDCGLTGEKMELKEIDTANRDVSPSVIALFFLRDALLFSSRVVFLVVRKSGLSSTVWCRE
jgi:hypothetical protein